MRSQTNPNRSVLRKATLLPFVFVMYSYATGGPFGLEDMVTTSGPGLTLLYQLFIPFFWCIPVSLVAAELTTAIPVEGGFYRWVRAGFGDFWGFQAGWWNWSASFLLTAAYAVLFTDYLTFFFPAIVGWKHYAVSLAVIALIAYVNVHGIRAVGTVATALETLIFLPLIALCVIAAFHWQHNPFSPLVPPHVPRFQVFGAGLALGLWLYSGYEQVSSVAEEVENPQRSYPRALAIVVPLSMATYFLPTMFSLAAVGNWQEWHTGYFSDAAQLIGGPWLGFAMTIAATPRKRDKLAAQLTWLANRGILGLPEDRRHGRVTPRNPMARLILPSGVNIACRVIDVSQSGAAIKSDQRPEIGTLVTIGKTPSRVVRHIEEGFAVEFIRLQHPDFLEENITGG